MKTVTKVERERERVKREWPWKLQYAVESLFHPTTSSTLQNPVLSQFDETFVTTSICCSYQFLNSLWIVRTAGDKWLNYKQCGQRSILMTVSAAGPGKGGGLLEKPTIERTAPGRESEFDLRYKYIILYTL